MLLGSCFLTYEDFNKRFISYKNDTKSNYSIHSSTSVLEHNESQGACVREDVIFAHLKFCCSRRQENPCPAYFVLQYDEKLDCLVIKDEDSDHVHTEELSNETESLSEKSEPLPKKLCSEKLFSACTDENTVQVCVNMEDLSDLDDCHGGSVNETDSLENAVLGDAVTNLTQLMNTFLSEDTGAKATMTIGSRQELEHLGFQTSKMGGLFEKYPESLVLHRVTIKSGYILYAFLVETKERGTKVVHFAFIRRENTNTLHKMLTVFQDFNAEWLKVKVIFTQIAFGHTALLKESFPFAQVLLSVYHMTRLIERKIRGPATTKEWLQKYLDDAIYNTSPEKLSLLAEKLQGRVAKELYDFLGTHWFSCEMLWYMHVKKGLHSCSTYMDSLDVVTKKIGCLLDKQSSIESGIQKFVENADCFNSKKVIQNKKTLPSPPKVSSPKPLGIIDTALNVKKEEDASPNDLQQEISKQGDKETAKKFMLCMKEWELVKGATHLISAKSNYIAVQILEQPQQISIGCRSCTCYFSGRYQLPCRHILSMLYGSKKPVELAMVSGSLQKKYIQPLCGLKVWNRLLHYANNEEEVKERHCKIRTLTKELSNLLLQCGTPELKARCCTLKNMIYRWSTQSKTDVSQDHVEINTVRPPYQWAYSPHPPCASV
uniref:Zinc finger SWIM-type containing 3 n=1 Tax=Xenopus tropicalis TaxID=8364 RepID=A0A6I8PS07_XENTR